MDVDTHHPDMTPERLAEWKLMADAMAGESAMKLAGDTYLQQPTGFAGHGDRGVAAFRLYKGRAQFPEILAPSVAAMIGIVHGKDIAIEIPPAMEYLLENADGDGLTLESFHRRITRALLVDGRYSVLADAPETGGNPYMRGYSGSALINWDRDWYVLDECGWVRNGFKWTHVERYRVLTLDGGAYVQTIYTKGDKGAWAADEIAPVARGAGRLPVVPIAVASARDVSTDVESPPLIGVARAALAIYQLSADYRWQLYMSGQETLVAINGPAPTAVGAGVVHSMQGGDGQTPDLKYVSPSCSGIDAHKLAMEDNRTAAIQAGARLLEQSDQVQESGNARKLRFASETATLSSVALSSCALLERALRNVALMMNIPVDGITVTPPKDLLDTTMTAAEAQALVGVWQAGGISYQTLYENLARGGIASPERDFVEETTLLDQEQVGAEPALQQPPMAANQG
jgi:hypothetical protein